MAFGLFQNLEVMNIYMLATSFCVFYYVLPFLNTLIYNGDQSFSTYAQFSKDKFLSPDTHMYLYVSRCKKWKFFGKFHVRTK